MEPIRHTLTARLKNIKMYREDVDQLVAIFIRDCKTVIISDSKFRYDSLEEMKDKAGPRIKDLDILSANPDVHFLFNQTEISKIGNPPLQGVYNELRTEEISDAADAVFYRLKDFVAGYERPSFNQGWLISMIVGVCGMFWFALHNSYVSKAGQAVMGSPRGFILSCAVFVISLVLSMGRGNYLTLETKRNSPSFLTKNWEAVLRQWIIAFGIGIIGWLIGHYGK